MSKQVYLNTSTMEFIFTSRLTHLGDELKIILPLTSLHSEEALMLKVYSSYVRERIDLKCVVTRALIKNYPELFI